MRYLCNLAPAVASISHLFQSQFLCGRPRRVGATLFGLGLLGSIWLKRRRQRCSACLRFYALCRTRHGFLRVSECHRLALPTCRRRLWLLSGRVGVWVGGGRRGGWLETGQLWRPSWTAGGLQICGGGGGGDGDGRGLQATLGGGWGAVGGHGVSVGGKGTKSKPGLEEEEKRRRYRRGLGRKQRNKTKAKAAGETHDMAAEGGSSEGQPGEARHLTAFTGENEACLQRAVSCPYIAAWRLRFKGYDGQSKGSRAS